MLSGFQIERIAYLGEGEVICRDCAIAQLEEPVADELDATTTWMDDDEIIETATDLRPLSRYEVDEGWAEEGLWCGECSEEIVEPPDPHDLVEWGTMTIEEHGEQFHAVAEFVEGRSRFVEEHDPYDHDHERRV